MPLDYRSRLVRLLAPLVILTPFAACTPEPDAILVELAPDVMSSIDGTLHVRGLVIAERTPIDGEPVRIDVAYTDRNGVTHDITGADIVTDPRGAFEAVLTGFAWEGTGTVTATVLSSPAGEPVMLAGEPLDGEATFAVLDRTPPTVEILPPTTDLHVGAGLPIDIDVHVTDEIGVSEIFLEASGELERLRSTVVASGSTDGTVTFRFDIPDDAIPGPTITLHALATDLSSNQAAAAPIVLIVDPAIAIATPSPLDGTLVADGTGSFLDDPRAIARSPKDGLLYVADASGDSPCQGGCIRRVDPSDGSVLATAVAVGVGEIEGLAFDASGDNLYYSDRPDRLIRLSYDTGSGLYGTPTTCNNLGAQDPQEPLHLVVDATLGVLVADRNDQRLKREAACTGLAPVNLSAGGLDQPWGVGLGAGGEVFVSDDGRDEILAVNRTSGAVTVFEDRGLDRPRGVEWMGAGVSPFADTLLVANHDDRTVISTAGPNTTRAVAFLRAAPIDVAVDGTTAFLLVGPRNGDPGQIFRVTGF